MFNCLFNGKFSKMPIAYLTSLFIPFYQQNFFKLSDEQKKYLQKEIVHCLSKEEYAETVFNNGSRSNAFNTNRRIELVGNVLSRYFKDGVKNSRIELRVLNNLPQFLTINGQKVLVNNWGMCYAKLINFILEEYPFIDVLPVVKQRAYESLNDIPQGVQCIPLKNGWYLIQQISRKELCLDIPKLLEGVGCSFTFI